ncbi:LysR family transcriptional regulator [Paraferrimonas sedimenticola]|uniref:Transcriptional regulator n=1 Tax=Paraferrimonas sedimenticola TaxID=375674 RepID=A0AA37RUA6_9GAMM|nr:LysR family transcriptional regulator [Paraferrimonas sedimenticola]GLP95685.1 transcriptional regulator [Paraferrimonas sedimenticola]
MAYTLDQLRAFVATVEGGSFRAAGLTIGKHSSTVSEQVANLEIDLGVDLFERSGRGIQLTEEGQDLYEHAKPVLRESDFFQAKADSLHQDHPTKFTLAIETCLRCPEVVACYQAVLEEFPGITLTVLNGDVDQVYAWLRSGKADVGLIPTNFQGNNEFAYSRGFSFAISNVVSREVFDEGASMSAMTLRSIPQILHSFMLNAGLEEVHRESHRVLVSNNANEMIEMSIAGLGWARVPTFLVERHSQYHKLRSFEVDDARQEQWWSELLHNSGRRPDRAMRLFMEKVKQIPNKL